MGGFLADVNMLMGHLWEAANEREELELEIEQVTADDRDGKRQAFLARAVARVTAVAVAWRLRPQRMPIAPYSKFGRRQPASASIGLGIPISLTTEQLVKSIENFKFPRLELLAAGDLRTDYCENAVGKGEKLISRQRPQRSIEDLLICRLHKSSPVLKKDLR
ncbi:hypothetical protein [Caenimonas soli]|uniref:hypothetical protein n=1 Tax=Caenimonas soli TaxID=2735555 RepID=UPI00155400C4|nr:hypothetical protein [Caenimonas soli]NPC56681.1 hypothetical protein [Caenimonas soli]